MILAKQGDWVEIQNVVSNSDKGIKYLRNNKDEIPSVQWIRGFMITKEATIGDEVEIETMIGRNARGCLCSINPGYIYDSGEPIKELIQVEMELEKEIEKLKNKK